MGDVEDLRTDLTGLLGRVERWLAEVGRLPDVVAEPSGIDDDAARVRALRTRALSTLLNVGILGRQSSGKSFLISGLQGRLHHYPMDDGSDQYIGLLPSSARPTTNCPATVVPVDEDPAVNTSGNGLLRVRFEDSDWVEIGTDLPPSVVAAYAAADGMLTDRRREHINRKVASVELLISGARLPVKFFDLPGDESPVEEFVTMMRDAWIDADCFIYASQATAALTSNELALIGQLYNHHLQTAKRVVWVLTGIDRATQHEAGQPAWRNVQEINTEYLRSHFSAATDRSDTFVGAGFVPVSAALEAQAASALAAGEAGRASRLLTASRMEILRDELTALVESGAGQRHISQIADETRRLVRRRLRPVNDVLLLHQVEVGDLERQQTVMRQRLDRMADSTSTLRVRLSDDLSRRVRQVSHEFHGLAAVLHAGLDALIDSGDLGAGHASEISVHQSRIFAEWMGAADGPTAAWQRELEALKTKAAELLEVELGEDAAGAPVLVPAPLDADHLLRTGGASGRRGHEIVSGATQAAVGAAAAVGGTVALFQALSLAAFATPVGAAVGAAVLAIRIAKTVRERETAINQARQARRRQIDEDAASVTSNFALEATGQGNLLIDEAVNSIEQYAARLRIALVQLGHRIASPDLVASRDLVARLAPVDEAGQAIITDLDLLTDRAGRPA